MIECWFSCKISTYYICSIYYDSVSYTHLATVITGGSSLPGLAAALIVALAGLAALVIWFVLALRGALLYLEVLAIPLALCGLYWGGTAHWFKRLVDLIIATIISQLIITMLMVLAAADLNSGQL